MIEEVANEYSEIHNAHSVFYCGALKRLDEDSALGPDMALTRILKRCAKILAPVLHMQMVAI